MQAVGHTPQDSQEFESARLRKRRRSPDEARYFARKDRVGPIEPIIRKRQHSRHLSRDEGTGYLLR